MLVTNEGYSSKGKTGYSHFIFHHYRQHRRESTHGESEYH